jgi:hypothetical protein
MAYVERGGGTPLVLVHGAINDYLAEDEKKVQAPAFWAMPRWRMWASPQRTAWRCLLGKRSSLRCAAVQESLRAAASPWLRIGGRHARYYSRATSQSPQNILDNSNSRCRRHRSSRTFSDDAARTLRQTDAAPRASGHKQTR